MSNKFTEQLPKMMMGEELIEAMAVFPEYDPNIREKSREERLIALSDLYQVFIPLTMSVEIYSKLYLAMLRSLQKKGTKIAVRQQSQNHRAIHGLEYSGIIGGSDSFTIIGTSGIGKSTAIARAIQLMTGNRIIEDEENNSRIIPCVIVQCPFDSSVKGMLLEILRKVDEVLDSHYYINAVRARATTDMLIGSVSQICLNHIGLLVIDEIQHVVNSKNGRSLIGSLTQLINNSGISICMVGTPESEAFFSQAMQLARRSMGLAYTTMIFDAEFRFLCETLWEYQYTQKKADLTEKILYYLYEHTQGNMAVLISLIHDAQEIAILNGTESLCEESLNEAYQKRLTMMHGYLKQNTKKILPKKKAEPVTLLPVNNEENPAAEHTIAEVVDRIKCQGLDVITTMKQYFTVEEVAV